MKLNIGAGIKHLEGYESCDIRPFEGTKYVFNAGKDRWVFEDNSVSEIVAFHVFEHMYSEEVFFAIDEAWRVLELTGSLYIEVPDGRSKLYYLHPDHKRAFTPDTFGFWMVPDNEGHVDVHSFPRTFWWVEVIEGGDPEKNPVVKVRMYPNKEGTIQNLKVS